MLVQIRPLFAHWRRCRKLPKTQVLNSSLALVLVRLQLRSGSGRSCGDGVRPDQVAQVERRIIEGADIVVTTLASAQNYKMKGFVLPF